MIREKTLWFTSDFKILSRNKYLTVVMHWNHFFRQMLHKVWLANWWQYLNNLLLVHLALGIFPRIEMNTLLPLLRMSSNKKKCGWIKHYLMMKLIYIPDAGTLSRTAIDCFKLDFHNLNLFSLLDCLCLKHLSIAFIKFT